MTYLPVTDADLDCLLVPMPAVAASDADDWQDACDIDDDLDDMVAAARSADAFILA
jgi:hypothetical protein